MLHDMQRNLNCTILQQKMPHEHVVWKHTYVSFTNLIFKWCVYYRFVASSFYNMASHYHQKRFRVIEFYYMASVLQVRSLVTCTASALYKATKVWISAMWRAPGGLGCWSRGRARPSKILQSCGALLYGERLAGLGTSRVHRLGPPEHYEDIELCSVTSRWWARFLVAWRRMMLHSTWSCWWASTLVY